MPTNRTRRRRRPVVSGVMASLKSGDAVEYTPENWDMLLGAYYFDDVGKLTDAERQRCRMLLDEWKERHLLQERESMNATRNPVRHSDE